MSNSRRGVGYWISAWCPVVAGIAVIVLESTKLLGADQTTGPLRWLYQLLFGPVDIARWGHIHYVIRKAGHFVGYGLLGLAWLRAWWMTLPRSRFIRDALLALLATGFVASADEFHQTFLPNRTGTPWDVLLDCCGAIVMQWIVFAWIRLFRSAMPVHRY